MGFGESLSMSTSGRSMNTVVFCVMITIFFLSSELLLIGFGVYSSRMLTEIIILVLKVGPHPLRQEQSTRISGFPIPWRMKSFGLGYLGG
jgi:hypothetical protein